MQKKYSAIVDIFQPYQNKSIQKLLIRCQKPITIIKSVSFAKGGTYA